MLTWGKVSANGRYRFFAIYLNGRRVATARAARDGGKYTTTGFQLERDGKRHGGPKVWAANARQAKAGIRRRLEGMGVAS